MTIYNENWPSLGYSELNCPKGKFKRQSWQLLCHSYVEGDVLWVLLLILFVSLLAALWSDLSYGLQPEKKLALKGLGLKCDSPWSILVRNS